MKKSMNPKTRPLFLRCLSVPANPYHRCYNLKVGVLYPVETGLPLQYLKAKSWYGLKIRFISSGNLYTVRLCLSYSFRIDGHKFPSTWDGYMWRAI